MQRLGGRDDSLEHYLWLSSYLEARGYLLRVRLLMGGLSAAMSAALLALLLGPDGPEGTANVAMMWLGLVGGVAGALLWGRRWPKYREALAFGLITTASTTLACLSHYLPLAALLGCFAFATVGAYLAFFHLKWLVYLNFSAAACVAIFQASRLFFGGHVALAFVDLMLVLQTNLIMPVAILVLVRALKRDLAQADRDPLTGLLNRRGLAAHIQQMIDRCQGEAVLVVLLIDLDCFKSINDRYGHHVGDEVLIDVAVALRSASPATAAVARSGGEEFLIADIGLTCKDAAAVAKRICGSVRRLRTPVTASIGIACVAIANTAASSVSVAVKEVVASADQAMYQAKRSGGNQFHDSGQLVRTTPRRSKSRRRNTNEIDH